jgi:competence protein ComEC
MGDAEKEAEASMLSKDSDILKVGHHGSRSSSSPAFLEAVSPEVSVIEVGKGNDYGHPAPETLSALKDVGSEIFRTDHDGNIDVTTDGESYFVTTERAASDTTTQTAISISAIQFDAPGDDRKNLNGEWIRITNTGQSPMDMTGWQLYDESGRVYVIPRFALSPGASVKISTGKGSDGATELYMGRGSPVWNNDGDTAILKDADGNAVSQRSG